MPNFAANLSFLYQDIPFLDRFEAARRSGFKAVEYLFPYDFPAETIAERLTRNGLVQALFNMPPGDWGKGERGIAALPGRESEFRDGVARALLYAEVTGCRTLHAMAGIWPQGRERAEGERVYAENLNFAADRLAAEGITLVIEPINTRDFPDYFLSTTREGMAAIERAGHSNLKLQLDLYHAQVMEGDLAHKIRDLAGQYAHVQIAGNPGRNEPDIGEIHYPFLFDLLDEVGYAGWVGCEYRPKGDTEGGLGWAKRYGIGRR